MIYCVEDERNIRELLIYTLETTGFKARGFGNGNELMKALKEEIPELILLDIMLPGDDGYTILEQLKSMPSVKDVPVIMVTAKEAEFDKVKGLLHYQAFRYDGICCQSKSSSQTKCPSE